MGILDQEYAAMVGAPSAFRDVAENLLATAALRHGNDQQAIDIATQKIADLTVEVANDNTVITALNDSLDNAKAKLAQLQSTVTYPDLEFNAWSVNDNAIVGGSGSGTNGQKPPDKDGWAEFSITPGKPVAPATANYYDAYYNKTFAPDATKKNFEMPWIWRFPTQADADAANCLEMESRQVVNGKMIVIAAQFRFGAQLQYWDAIKKWTPSVTAQPKAVAMKEYSIVMAGHRDDANVYHDYISVNGVKTDLTGTSYIAQATDWRPMIRFALQLDGKGSALPFRVQYRAVNPKAW